MKHTDTVSEPGVCRSRIDQFRKSQLFDPAQTLEWTSLDNPPKNLLKLTDA